MYKRQKFDRVPQRAETLTLTSRAQVSKHGSVKRITTLTDAEGKEVAMVDCRWIVASLAEGRILREPGWTVENFWNDTVEGELPLQLHKCCLLYTSSMTLGMVFVFVLPAAVLIAGAVEVLLRRRR